MSQIIQYNKPSKLIFDKKSKRKIDPSTGQLIADVLITAEEVVQYAGFENEQFIEDGFEATDIINVYRPWEEIKKGAETIQGKPGIWGHAETNVDNIKELPHIGTVLSSTYLDEKNHQLSDKISIHDKSAIEDILNGNDGVSAGYVANYVKQNGVFKGKQYDYIQTDIEYNHLAVGVDPRCAVARVLDSKPSFLNVMEGDKPMSKKINVADESLVELAKNVEDSETIVADSDTKVPSLGANKDISPELNLDLIFDESEEEMTGDKDCDKTMAKDEKEVEKEKKSTEDSLVAAEIALLRKEVNQIKKEKFETLHFVFGVVNDKDLNEILPLFPEAEPTVGLTPNAKLLFRPVLRDIELLLEDPQPGQAASLRALEVEPSKLIRNIILILLNIKCI